MVLPSSRRVLELAFGAAAVTVLAAACSRSGIDLLDYGGTSGPPSADSGTGTTPMSACTPPAAGAVVTLASSPYGWWTLAVDSTDVYAIAGAGGGNVVRVSLCGGTPVTLAEANAQALAIDATNVYWTDSPTGADMTVKMVAKTGGTQTVLAKLPYEPPFPAVGSNGIAVDSSAVYVLGEGQGGGAGACSDGAMNCGPGDIVRIPLDGGTPTTLATEQDGPAAIALDATNVYWVNYGPRVYYQGETHRQGTVMSVPLTGGSVTTLATGQYEPQGIGVQGSVLYWVGDNGSIVTMPTSGGPTQTLMADDLFLEGVVADAEGLYLVDASGAIEALPLTGGMPTTIASSNASYNTGEDPIVVDATSLYWRDGNDLLRAAK